MITESARDPLNAEFDLLNEVAAAAADLDKIMSALIRTGDTKIVSTDIGAAALLDRLNRLNDAQKELRSFRKGPAKP